MTSFVLKVSLNLNHPTNEILDMLCQQVDRYQKAIDATVQSLVMEAVNQMMAVRSQKQVVTDESVRDQMEQQYSPDTVLTPTCTPPAPVTTSTPADVCT